MRKFTLLYLVALAGCFRVVPQHGTGGVYTTALAGVEVPVKNNTNACLDIVVSDGQSLDCLGPGKLVFIRSNRGHGYEEITIDVTARTQHGLLLGSTSRRFQIPAGRTRVHNTWEISSVRRVRDIVR